MSENCANNNLIFNVNDGLKLIKEWLKTEEYFPENIDNIVLKHFLICCDGDVQITKELLKRNFIHRSKSPEIFKNRDVCEEWTKKYLTHSDIVILPRRTEDNSSIVLIRYIDDYRNLTMPGCYKGVSLMYDLFTTEESLNSNSAIYIQDLGRCSLMQLGRMHPLSVLKSYMYYIQECIPIQMKQIHMVNIPWFWEKMMNMVNPLIKPELTKMLHLHSNPETLYEYVPREYLPEEYGGYLKSIEEYSKDYLQKLHDKREYFLDESKWWVNEEKLKEHLIRDELEKKKKEKNT